MLTQASDIGLSYMVLDGGGGGGGSSTLQS